jgi:hypothetical protein
MRKFSYTKQLRRGGYYHYMVLELKRGWLAQVVQSFSHAPEGWDKEIICENTKTADEALSVIGYPVELKGFPKELL